MALPILLIVAGTLARMYAGLYARFTGDESQFWAIALDIAHGRSFPSFGPPLTGSSALHPGPLFYYLMALPQLLGDSPLFGSVFIALLHGASALLLVSWLEQMSGPRAGVIGAALWAFLPWDVLYSDRIWLGNVMGPFGLLTLYAAGRAARAPAWQALLAGLLLIAPQIHMSAPSLALACALRFGLEPERRIQPRALALGLLAGALSYTPALLSELHTGFANLGQIAAKAGGHAPAAQVWRAPLHIFGYAGLSASSEIGYHLQRDYWTPFGERVSYLSLAGAVRWISDQGWLLPLQLASLALVGWSWWAACARLLRARKTGALGAFERSWASLLLGLSVATVLLMIARKDFFPHYVLLFVPATILPVVELLAGAAGRRRTLAFVLFGASLSAMALNLVRYYRDVDALNDWAVVACVAERIAASPEPVQLVFDDFDNTPAVLRVLEQVHQRTGRVDADASVMLVVHNDRRARADELDRCAGVALSEARR